MRGHHLSFLVTSSQLRNKNTMIQPEVTPRPYLDKYRVMIIIRVLLQ